MTASDDALDIVFQGLDEAATYGQIAYYHDGGLYVMNPDGSDPALVTSSPFFGRMSWSPDRDRLAFARQGDGININLHFIDVDGTNEQEMFTEDMQNLDPSWSPDGTRVAYTNISYTASQTGVDVIHVRDVASGNLTESYPSFYSRAAAWSPDGDRIAFMSNHYHHDPSSRSNPTPEIFVRNADGSGTPDQLTSGGGSVPSWSPDGIRIAYTAGGDIHVMDSDGSNATTLAAGSWPTWSMDGSKIAFVRDGHIWTMDADGGNQTEITEGNSPAWRD